MMFVVHVAGNLSGVLRGQVDGYSYTAIFRHDHGEK